MASHHLNKQVLDTTGDTRPPLSILTQRQAEVLEYLLAHVERHGFQPTVRELMARFGIASPNGVTCHLLALERKGLIRLGRPFRQRAIRLIGVAFIRVVHESTLNEEPSRDE